MAKLNKSDEYFNRSYQTVAGTDLEQVPVCYGVFCRKPGLLCGVTDVIALIDEHCPGPLILRSKSDGDPYESQEMVMSIEGPFGQLVTLETLYLGMLSVSAAAGNMAAIVGDAGDVPVVDMAARHYPPEMIGAIAKAAAVGGARGTSTRLGYDEVLTHFGIGGGKIKIGDRLPVLFDLYGTIPHSLNALYQGSSIESAVAFHEKCPDLPLTVLLDFEGRERDVCSQAVKRFGSELYAVRLDVPSNRIHQGGHDQPTRTMEMRILSSADDRQAAQQALEQYGFGPGVTVESVYAIRDLLDSMGNRSTKIVVSSGFNLQKVRAFKACLAPMDFIGTGSWVEFATFTSDIIRVKEKDQWIDRCKAGRREEIIEPESLPIILNKS
ncbi:MAG: beta/alpha barrel domain-containing protein [Planctomycetota bacterium]|jgi:nicotinate phosphoribosyltransferase